MADVLSGVRVVGKLVRLAVERHQRDLQDGPARGLTFDPIAAARAIKFYAFLRHSKGEWAGKPLELNDWQCFILWVLFGWRRADGMRRFRTAYVEVPRKNGKSTFASGVGLELLVADGEPGAEVYTAATKRDQARIVHGEAVRMVKSSPELKRIVGIFKDNLHVQTTNSKFEPLGADSDTMDGLNVSGGIIDEFHAHKKRDVYDLLDTATGARRQPLLFIITTAGSDEQSVCFELHDHGIKVLEDGGKGQYPDDTLFVFIASIDEGDDPFDPKVWEKANPNYGVSVKPDDLERKAERARQIPSARNAFLRLHLNVWTQTATAWLDIEKWDACQQDFRPEEWAGAEVFGGLDLASKLDITAFVLLLKKDGKYCVVCRFWIPKDTAAKREKRDRIPYKQWIDDGLIKATEGSVTDYDVVEAEIADLCRKWRIGKLGFDPHNATQLSIHLQDRYGIEMLEFGQGTAHMNEPCREMEKLIEAKEIVHDGNAVLRWMIGNVSVKTNDITNEIKPAKPDDKSNKKIDGVVALLMALGVATTEPDNRSIYNETDLLVI
jgi:phage terminase large subunit-like protein